MFCLAFGSEHGSPLATPYSRGERVHTSGVHWASQDTEWTTGITDSDTANSPSKKEPDVRVNHSGNHT